ncbi:MAG: carboxymuconolactone decarboxylase [Candidatus Solincola sediminis]|nr:MAG: carboxymuconolactone decarboxylase [Candidatus Solincola sediminis]
MIQAIRASKGLDQKTKQLIYIAMKTALGDATAVRFHVPMAKKLGAKREEIVDAILMTLTVVGISGVVSILPEALQIYDESI